MPKFTIFSIPKPFVDPHISIIQRNAIQSWKQLDEDIEIMLMGNEEGLKEVANEFDVRHFPNVKLNSSGTPLLSSAFEIAYKKSQTQDLLFINSDIIIFKDLADLTSQIELSSFLLIGKRIDLDVTKPINYNNKHWSDELLSRGETDGKLHAATGIDYFYFKKEDWKQFPDFAVGRPGWDNWFIYEARRRKIPVINATQSIKVIHQNHHYFKYQKNDKGKWLQSAKDENKALIGGNKRVFTIDDTNWKIQNGKLKRKRASFCRMVKYLADTPEVLEMNKLSMMIFTPPAKFLVWFIKLYYYLQYKIGEKRN